MPLPSVLQHWRLGDRRDIQCEKNLVGLWETFMETGLTWSNLWKRLVKEKPKAVAAASAALSFHDAWPKVSKHWRHKHSTTLCTDYLSHFCTLLTSVPGRPLIRSSDTNCWYHGLAWPALDCVPSVLLVRLPGMTCRLICATWTYL